MFTHMYLHIMSHYAFQHFNTISCTFTLLDQMVLGCFNLQFWTTVTSNFTTLQQNAQRILGFKVYQW